MKGIFYKDRATGELVHEKVPGESWLQWLYQHPFGNLALHGLVKRKFVSAWYGREMDKPGSKNRIRRFVDEMGIDMSEAVRSIEEFNTFNDFFIRELKPQARPIDPAPDSIVSPADGKVVAFQGFTELDTFFAKGQEFSIVDFLQNRELADTYRNGTLLIIRLAPVDYHRFHFPANGFISRSTHIHGDYYSVSPYAVRTMLRIYWENKREYSILQTNTAGNILLCEVGATMVGSIVQSYTPQRQVAKGQEKGWFTFGGSTVVMLLEQGTIRIDEDILENTKNGFETSIRMGERLGTALLPCSAHANG